MKTTTEGRRPVIRQLPALKDACAGFGGFQKGDHRTERMAEMLSTVIQRCRRNVPVPFYAMRDVAEFFNVSLCTTARVYRQLSRKGGLTLMRSSQTMIAPRSRRANLALRGVVYMPIWLPGFLRFLDWRKWLSIIEDELSHHHFAAEPIFFKQGEEVQPAFVERVLKFNPDYILWLCPASTDINTMRGFTDAGIPVLAIPNFPDVYPVRCYPLSNENGLRQGLAEWQADRIDQVIVPQWHSDGGIVSTLAFQAVLKSSPLPSQFEVFTGRKFELKDYLLRLLARPRCGIIFDDDYLYCHMSLWEPEIMVELFRKHRCLVGHHILTPTGSSLDGITVDSLFYQWKQLARRIAVDLSQNKGFLPATHPPFQAKWRARTPLTEAIQIETSE